MLESKNAETLFNRNKKKVAFKLENGINALLDQ